MSLHSAKRSYKNTGSRRWVELTSADSMPITSFNWR